MANMKLKTILGVALAAGALASCQVDDNESASSKVNEEYTRQFIKEFGTINPNQDWSVAEQKSVTVSLATPSHVKIYEKQGGEFRLAADYNDVTDQTITFDGMKGDNTPFLVYVDDACYAVENGQTLAVGSAAKGGPLRADKIPEGVSWIKRGSTSVITVSTADNVLKALAKNNGQNNVETALVNEIVSSGYSVISQGQAISFYPVYWNSPKKHTVGIYYYQDGHIVTCPLYADKTDSYKSDDDKHDLLFNAGTNDSPVWCPVETDAENCWHFSHTTVEGKGDTWDISYNVGESFKFQSHSYTITPTTSLSAGVYVEIDGSYYFSDAALNGGKCFFAQRVLTGGDGSIGGESHGTYSYICFDDPNDNGGEGDKDYNDVVFLTPQQITPVTPKETEWTIACEDLGGTYDYDFNDIVFRVRHVSGTNYAYIFPVAAGGTLSAELFYNGNKISDEWHTHFGKGYDQNVMINTGKGPEEHAVKTIRVNGLPTDWSIMALTDQSNGLVIKVTRTNGQVNSVTGPSAGSAPQMLILPYDWQWPKELTRITAAYPDFGTWGENYTSSSWLDKKVTENIITGFSDTEITSNGQKTVNLP